MPSLFIETEIKIVAINGSPNKSRRTGTAMGWGAEGARLAGAEIAWYHLSELNVNYCQGCHACLETGDCNIHDDVQQIHQKLKPQMELLPVLQCMKGVPRCNSRG